jgi:SAM-dependent methyltransferase
MYDFEWHKEHADRTTSSAETVIGILASFLDIQAVLDVGCGDGRWLAVCRAKGAATIAGIDGPWTDPARLAIPPDTVVIRDLGGPFDLGRRFSLAMCLEVGEHLTGACSPVLVDNLVRHSDVVLFSAAVPFQSGFRHVNEQWQSYWSGLFEARGFATYDPLRHRIWNDESVHFWYKQNMLLYVSRANRSAMRRVLQHLEVQRIQQLPLDVVHPEKYLAVASYRQIAYRPLIKALPAQLVRKSVSILTGKI